MLACTSRQLCMSRAYLGPMPSEGRSQYFLWALKVPSSPQGTHPVLVAFVLLFVQQHVCCTACSVYDVFIFSFGQTSCPELVPPAKSRGSSLSFTFGQISCPELVPPAQKQRQFTVHLLAQMLVAKPVSDHSDGASASAYLQAGPTVRLQIILPVLAVFSPVIAF